MEFFSVHWSDRHVFSFCSHFFKCFKIFLSSFYFVLVDSLSTKLSLYINLQPSDSAKENSFPPESALHHKAGSILFSVLVSHGIYREVFSAYCKVGLLWTVFSFNMNLLLVV